MIEAVSKLFNEHHSHEEKLDITTIVNVYGLKAITNSVDLSLYDEVSIEDEVGQGLYFVSSVINGDSKMFFVESVQDSEGELKIDDTDVLIVSSFTNEDIIHHASHECSHDKFIVAEHNISYSDLLKAIKN